MVARTIILGGEPVTSLAQAPALAGAVSVGLGQTDDSGSLQQEGQDYRLKSVRYFEDKEWAVASIKPLNNDADPAVLVLKKINGVYQTVLGPAGQFTNSYLYVMPSDVGQYLVKQGAFGG
jgi:hypothetical protein